MEDRMHDKNLPSKSHFHCFYSSPIDCNELNGPMLTVEIWCVYLYYPIQPMLFIKVSKYWFKYVSYGQSQTTQSFNKTAKQKYLLKNCRSDWTTLIIIIIIWGIELCSAYDSMPFLITFFFSCLEWRSPHLVVGSQSQNMSIKLFLVYLVEGDSINNTNSYCMHTLPMERDLFGYRFRL